MSNEPDTRLSWPSELARKPARDEAHWLEPGSNICLDFHGDPRRAELVVFSDGNHHMALEESLQAFVARSNTLTDIFYATIPPGVLLNLLEQGSLHLGNLRLSVSPQVFIGPADVLDKVAAMGRMGEHHAFMQSRGHALLVNKGNPKHIHGVRDLLREDVRWFISNPVREKASYGVYRDSLLAIAGAEDAPALQELLDHGGGRVVFGNRIHHREAPQTVAGGEADAAVVYYHLALRYVRIFPERFEMISLDGAPEPSAASVATRYHIGLVDDGGAWGAKLLAFMRSPEVAQIYARHGLRATI